MEKLLNEENTWDNATTCENVGEPCDLIRREDCYLGDMLDADGGCNSAVTASHICLEKVS